MKVAVDIGPLKSGDKVRGVGFYTKELLQVLEEKSKRAKTLEIYRLSSEELQKRSSKFDIIHIPYFNPYFLTVPRLTGAKLIVTIHDATPLLYPKEYPPGIKGRMRLHLQKKRLKDVSAIITDSESSKKDIVKFLDVPKEKVHVIYLAAAKHFRKLPDSNKFMRRTKDKFKLPEKFVLYTGDVNYNKNVPTLVEACAKIDTQLVIVGKQAKTIKEGVETHLKNIKGPRDWYRYLLNKPHPEEAHYTKLSKLLNREDVACLGFVSDEELVALFNLAGVYCQPSYAEGFGLPVLEALACGTPVVISRTPALMEIAGRYTTHFDPNSVSGLSGKLKKAISSGSRVSDEKISDIAKAYNWAKTAKETLEVYENTLSW